MRLLLSFLSLILIFSCQSDTQRHDFIKPTDTIVKMDMEDGSQKELKKSWMKLIHKTPPGMDWEVVELQNLKKKHANKKNQPPVRAGEEEIIVPGHLAGKWVERGSSNQSGSVHASAYNKNTGELFVISDGRNLWLSNEDGTSWAVQNEYTNLDPKFLVSFVDGSNTRLVASMLGQPHYSDDKGISWTPSDGINTQDGWSRISRWAQIQSNGYIFILHKRDYWANISLYISKDQGTSFQPILGFNTNDMNNFALCSPRGSGQVYFLEQITATESRIHVWNHDNDVLEVLHESVPHAFGSDGRANLIGTYSDAVTSLFSYLPDLRLMKSVDLGMTWTQVGTLPSNPWGEMFISPSDPDLLIYGEVNAYRSQDGGANWELINEWWEYYGDPLRKLHADIMYIEEFDRSDGSSMILISNHGGISKSTNGSLTNTNIALEGLNVSQYYDVRTHPVLSNFLFAGSQDQGFQRGQIDNDSDDVFPLDQPISGDYGHIEFTQFGQSMWMVYPGGWVSYYNDPLTGGITKDYTLESEDETVWIPPIVASPDVNEDAVYMAGGNKDGGTGSYLIKLLSSNSGLEVTQFEHDFIADGTISAIAFNQFNPDIIYVATTGGAFYISKDAGLSFERKAVAVPNAHYLYGACIYPSTVDENVIYLSGAGYGNPAVFKSTNGGESFEPMNDGMPATLAFCLDGNSDESLIFAATEAGPYVFVTELEQWFDLSGMSAPAQRYWSLEYIDALDVVRFGTYGRGIWDFQISEIISNVDVPEVDQFIDMKVYPNPAQNRLFIDNNIRSEIATLTSISGTFIQEIKLEKNSIDLNNIPAGMYIISIREKNKTYTAKFQKS